LDIGIVIQTLGLLLVIEAIAMLPSLAVALLYGEGDAAALLFSIAATAAAGLLAYFARRRKGVIRYREGFLIVGLGWVAVAFFGALPFHFAGVFPSFIDAFFETVSGFTTTGATVMTDIEIQKHGILFWRSFTIWLGGMGILVFTLALLPALGQGTMQIMAAESPGPAPGKLVPRVAQTAKILYSIYTVPSLAEVILLRLSGLSWFDSFTHTFSTMGTGGFSNLNASVGGYHNPLAEWIMIIFMVIAGTNFSLYYGIRSGNLRTLFNDSEYRFYLLIIFLTIALIVGNIIPSYGWDWNKAVRDASFQVTSIVTTTGLSTLNYEVWPAFSKMLLFLLMFFGGCAGSTGGSIKQIRILIGLKATRRDMYALIHPRAVTPVLAANKAVPENVVREVMSFIFLYLLLFVFASLVLLTQNLDIITSTSAVAATLGNIGPGFNLVGPVMNYAGLTPLTKVVLSLCMLLGRLEIYPLLILLMPGFWKK
jgi:trk system potassium uptake protein TrkH